MKAKIKARKIFRLFNEQKDELHFFEIRIVIICHLFVINQKFIFK